MPSHRPATDPTGYANDYAALQRQITAQAAKIATLERLITTLQQGTTKTATPTTTGTASAVTVATLPGGVTLAVPVPLSQGGTGAIDAAGARSALGLGTMAQEAIGGSFTVALAKITGGGADGSLTTVNGVVTAYVPPT